MHTTKRKKHYDACLPPTRLKKEDYNALVKMAAKQRRTVTEMVRLILTERIATAASGVSLERQ